MTRPQQQMPVDPRRVRLVHRRRRRYTFRSPLVIVPGLCLGAALLLQTIGPCVRWGDVMQMLGVTDREEYTRLGTWVVLLITAVALVRILMNRGSDED